MIEKLGGRKFVSTVIGVVLIFLGLMITNKMKISSELYGTYCRWIIIALGIFAGSNGVITISSLIGGKNND